MKTRAFTAILMTAAFLVAGSAGAQQYNYSYGAQPYGGTLIIIRPNDRGGAPTRTIIYGPARGGVIISDPSGGLTTGAIDQFGNWYTITTRGNIYTYPRPVR